MASNLKTTLLHASIGLLVIIGTLHSTKALPAESPKPGNYLFPGEFLRPLGKLYSPNGLFYLTYQTDGNLVLYKCSAPFCDSINSPSWSSNTAGNTPGIFNVDPRDGFIHVWSINSVGVYIESAKFGGNVCGGNYLKLQDDGNLVIYRVNPPYGETSGSAEWGAKSNVGNPPECPLGAKCTHRGCPGIGP